MVDEKEVEVEEEETIEETIERAMEDVGEKPEVEVQEPETEEDEDGLQEEVEVEGEEEEGREEKPVAEFEEEKPEEEKPEEDEDELEAAVEPGDIQPIEFWPEEVKKDFKNASKAQQEFLIQTYKGMTRGYNERLEGIKDVTEALKPIEQECLENGIKYSDAIRRMVGMHSKLMTKPQEAIFEVMQMYGIEPAKLGETPAAPAPGDDRVAAIEARLAEQQRSEAERATAAYQADIDKFRADHPLYDEAEPGMLELANRYVRAGMPVPKVDKLYEEFCWSDPKFRAKMLEEQKAASTKEKVVKRKQTVAKARNASRSVKRRTMPASPEDSAGKTLRDVLSEQIDAAEASAKN